jgi:hypothetical protein
MIDEQRIRKYALQCCLCVIRRGEASALFERVPGTRRVKSLVGTYRSWPAVKGGSSGTAIASSRGISALPLKRDNFSSQLIGKFARVTRRRR